MDSMVARGGPLRYDPSSFVVKLRTQTKKISLLSWSVLFLILAIRPAALGFGGLAGTFAGIAKRLFLVFLILLHHFRNLPRRTGKNSLKAHLRTTKHEISEKHENPH